MRTLLYAHGACDCLLEEEPNAHDAKDLDAGPGHVHHESLHGDGFRGRGGEFPGLLLAQFVEIDGGPGLGRRGGRRAGELAGEGGERSAQEEAAAAPVPHTLSLV